MGLEPKIIYSLKVDGCGMYYGSNYKKAMANYETEKQFARLFSKETHICLQRIEVDPITKMGNSVYLQCSNVSKNRG